MKVLVACECFGKVKNAFRAKGHDAWSCDLMHDESSSKYHIRGDVLKVLNNSWDMLIAFPPCTDLAVSGARWFEGKRMEQGRAIWFFAQLALSPIERICIENPIGIMSTIWRKPDQIIQPWQFGHGETKATCLWLKNLPKLTPTNIVEGREPRIHKMPPSKDRGKLRSITYDGYAQAMAEQWG